MDIVILAAIAVLIFFKLRKQLGMIDEEERKNIEEKIRKSREEMLSMQQRAADAMRKEGEMRVVNPTNSQKPSDIVQIEVSKNEAFIVSSAADEQFQAILSDCKITSDFFLNGVKTAFEMIIESFAEGDIETLQSLLSEKVFQNFSAAINQRKGQNQTLTTNLIAVEKIEVVSASKNENTALVTVAIVSRQINYITDSAQNIVKGSKTQISEINDVWTFEKDVTSSNPTWFVVATHA